MDSYDVHVHPIQFQLYNKESFWTFNIIKNIFKYNTILFIGRWFSPGTPVSSTNETDRYNITEIVLKVWLIHHNANPNPP
jgi:hypothetical protein